MTVKRRCDEPQALAQVHTAPNCQADLALVQRLIANNDSAWSELVTSYAGQLRSRVSRVTKNCQAANQTDCVDDILAELFRVLLANNHAALRAFQGRSSLSTYLCAIATRVALRHIARLGADVHLAEPLWHITDMTCTSPDQRELSREVRSRLLGNIDRLPLKQQQLIRLFHLEGKSYKEISEQMRIPIGSIGPSLGRAEAVLRQLLGEDFLN